MAVRPQATPSLEWSTPMNAIAIQRSRINKAKLLTARLVAIWPAAEMLAKHVVVQIDWMSMPPVQLGSTLVAILIKCTNVL